ncbi:hypothetical protein C8R45DRAFT_1044403 [Mycena sanguinolenta]|nr:hypothetical protein C8R45DRAFT_1044403 [Mycena sanguinolenta]
MARASAAANASLKAIAIVSSLTTVVFLVFFITPYLIERHYPAAAPIAAAVVWVKGAIEHMLASLASYTAFILLLSLVIHNVCGYRATPPGPLALEEGTAAASTPTPCAPAERVDKLCCTISKLPITTKLFLSVSFIYFTTWHIFRRTEIVSSERSFFENLGSALLYLCHGLTVPQLVFWVWFVRKVVRSVRKELEKRRSAAVAARQADSLTAPRVEVLFDDAAFVEVKEEKA